MAFLETALVASDWLKSEEPSFRSRNTVDHRSPAPAS